MNLRFSTEFVKEPQLVFGKQNEERDPKIGLSRYGPFRYEDEDAPLESIRIGVIGNRHGISLTLDVLDLIKDKIPTYHDSNKWLFPNYPGLTKSSNFRCNIHTSKIWQAQISDDFELNEVTSTKLADPNKRIAYGVNLFVEKMKKIAQNDDRPDVVICTLPKIIETYCGISEKTRGAKTAKATEAEIKLQKMKDAGQKFLSEWGANFSNEDEEHDKSFDFRNALKGKIMKFDIPIQILHETTCEHMLDYNSTSRHFMQDPCAFAWNLSTALFYKANGKPWRLAKLPQDTCYVGISFFRDKLHLTRDIQISMAQIFTHTGEGLVLRGKEVDIHEHTKQPYLKKEQARDLLARAINRYKEKVNQNPGRVVIHKTTEFLPDEKLGFNEAILQNETYRKDFVTIKSDYNRIKFMRVGKFPPLRGTIINLDRNRFLLYSSGYTPRIRTYPGHSIPNPLMIHYEGDSTMQEITREILGLTKLNWNTTSFATFLPITIKFAHEVGKILSELPDNEMKKDHYRFFM